MLFRRITRKVAYEVAYWFITKMIQVVIDGKKQCSRCREWLLLEKFHKRKILSSGYCSACSKCEAPFKRERDKRYKSSSSSKFKAYKEGAKQRNLEFRLTYKDFLSFWQKPCGYCGDKIETIGLDRINNEKGYMLGNIMSCCRKCNRMKGRLLQEEFINHCRKIIKRQGL